MKILLTADLKKLFKGKALYFLVGASVILPLFTTLFIALLMFITTQVGEANAFAQIFSPTVLYVTSFSLLNNIGLALLITLILVSAGDFTQATIRNKVVAGHKREHIFYSSLITNLLFAFLVMFTYSSLSYLFSSFIVGFTLDAFLVVLKFGFIGFSSYLVLYTIATLIMFRYKNDWAPILLVIGVMIGISIVTFIVNIILSMNKIEFNIMSYIFPVNYINSTGVGILVDKFEHFWIYTLVNLAYFTLFFYLGHNLSRKTDFH